MTTTTFSVAGMTCGHCVTAVSSELATLPGVTAVDVNLATGAVTVTSTEVLNPADVAAAVDEAGYELAATGPATTGPATTGPATTPAVHTAEFTAATDQEAT